LLPALLAFFSGTFFTRCASRPTTPAASEKKPAVSTLRITFVGACDFVRVTSTGFTKVVLPAFVNQYAGYGIKDPHIPFVRTDTFAYTITKPASITLRDEDGQTLSAGPVDTSELDPHVHKMTGTPDDAAMKRGLVLELPKGKLIASKTRPQKYVFVSPMGKPSNEDYEIMASEATYVTEIPKSAPSWISIFVGDAEIRVAVRDGAATVTIGNLPAPEIFYFGNAYVSLCMDHHFLLHYTLGPPTDIKTATIPQWLDPTCGVPPPVISAAKLSKASSSDSGPQQAAPPPAPPGDSSPIPFGSREDCFMARWEI
jgi:hypothetical protein